MALYLTARRAADAEPSDEQVGRTLAAAIDEWPARLPIEDFWPALTRSEACSELRFLAHCLLVTPQARRRFGARLADTFPEALTIHAALAAEPDFDEEDK